MIYNKDSFKCITKNPRNKGNPQMPQNEALGMQCDKLVLE